MSVALGELLTVRLVAALAEALGEPLSERDAPELCDAEGVINVDLVDEAHALTERDTALDKVADAHLVGLREAATESDVECVKEARELGERQLVGESVGTTEGLELLDAERPRLAVGHKVAERESPRLPDVEPDPEAARLGVLLTFGLREALALRVGEPLALRDTPALREALALRESLGDGDGDGDALLLAEVLVVEVTQTVTAGDGVLHAEDVPDNDVDGDVEADASLEGDAGDAELEAEN